MVEYNHLSNSLKITIPNSGLLQLATYRRSILCLLSKLEIDNCDSEQKENIKAIYGLLSHLESESKSIPLKELDKPLLKN